MTWPFGDLRPLSYDLIVADPMWDFESYSEKGEVKGPRAQYACLSPEEICERFPLDMLAGGDCLLLCWATNPLIDRQIACVKRWGFTFKTMCHWEKVFRSGKSAIGPGYRARTMTEPVIMAVMGEPRHKAFPGLFKGVRRQHSRKPEEFYRIVEDRCPRLFRRADIFGRQTRAGWDVYGNEATKFDAEAA